MITGMMQMGMQDETELVEEALPGISLPCRLCGLPSAQEYIPELQRVFYSPANNVDVLQYCGACTNRFRQKAVLGDDGLYRLTTEQYEQRAKAEETRREMEHREPDQAQEEAGGDGPAPDRADLDDPGTPE